MKKLITLFFLSLGFFATAQPTYNTNGAISHALIHDGAVALCECTSLVQNRLSVQFQDIVSYKILADSYEEWEGAMVLFINNNPEQAARDLAVIEEMGQEGKPFMQCIHKMEMNFAGTGVDTPASYELMMMELYEIQCEFAAALMQFGMEISNNEQ